MKLDLGGVARDTATGVARAWPWLVFAVLFRMAGDLAEIRIDIALTELDPSRQGMRSDSLSILIVREVLDGLVLGVVVAAVLHALGVLPGGRLARGLRAWPTAFATGLIWALPFLASAGMDASAGMRPNGIGFGVSVVGSVTLVAAVAALILSVFLGYATGGAVVRGTGVIASVRDSLRLTRGHGWRLLLVTVGLMMFAGLAKYGGDILFGVIRGPWTSFAAESLTVRSASVLSMVVGAAVWANLDRMRRRENPNGMALAGPEKERESVAGQFD